MTARPQIKPDAEQWVESLSLTPAKAEPQEEGDMKRLTIDVPMELHTHFKIKAATRKEKMADVIRQLIESYVGEA